MVDEDGKGDLTVIDLVLSQLTNAFRIGLIIALVFTTFRNQATTGRVLPLAAGVVFVAVILPSTLPSGTATLTEQILAGLVSNGIILAIVLACWALVARLRG
jgi:hypothetical protein